MVIKQLVMNAASTLYMIWDNLARDMTNYDAESPKFKADKVQISERSQKVWNECASSPSPQSIGVEV